MAFFGKKRTVKDALEGLVAAMKPLLPPEDASITMQVQTTEEKRVFFTKKPAEQNFGILLKGNPSEELELSLRHLLQIALLRSGISAPPIFQRNTDKTSPFIAVAIHKDRERNFIAEVDRISENIGGSMVVPLQRQRTMAVACAKDAISTIPGPQIGTGDCDIEAIPFLHVPSDNKTLPYYGVRMRFLPDGLAHGLNETLNPNTRKLNKTLIALNAGFGVNYDNTKVGRDLGLTAFAVPVAASDITTTLEKSGVRWSKAEGIDPAVQQAKETVETAVSGFINKVGPMCWNGRDVIELPSAQGERDERPKRVFVDSKNDGTLSVKIQLFGTRQTLAARALGHMFKQAFTQAGIEKPEVKRNHTIRGRDDTNLTFSLPATNAHAFAGALDELVRILGASETLTHECGRGMQAASGALMRVKNVRPHVMLGLPKEIGAQSPHFYLFIQDAREPLAQAVNAVLDNTDAKNLIARAKIPTASEPRKLEGSSKMHHDVIIPLGQTYTEAALQAIDLYVAEAAQRGGAGGGQGSPGASR
jgi:hypothetical protein